MAERITVKDVRRAFEAHAKALEKCGIPYTGKLVLQEGSAVNGRAWRLFQREDDSGGLRRPPIGDDFLGMTARDAYGRLVERTGTIYDTRAALEKKDAAPLY